MAKNILRSQENLMDALLEILKEKDYDSISVSEICSVSGYSRGTFYQNFQDKDDLLDKLTETKLQKLKNIHKNLVRVTSLKDIKKMPRDKSISFLFEYIRDNRYFFETVLKDNKIIGFRSKMFLTYKESHQELLNVPLNNFSNDYDINDLYFNYVTSAFLGVTIYWINEGMHKSPDYLTEQLVSIAFTRPHDLILGNLPFKKKNPAEVQRTDPRISRTQKALKHALIFLMKCNKYDQIKVNDICTVADYNRSTFYSHYKDKDQLYHDIVSDWVKGMVSAIRPSPPSTNGRIGNGIDSSPLVNFFAYIYENRTLLKIMYSDNKVPGFFNKIYTGLTDLFYEELEGRLNVDTEIYCNYISSTLMTAMGFFISDKIKYSPIYLADKFAEILRKQPEPYVV